jgi:RNA polymerase sigma-70 factor (ECF subfamily)
MPWLQPYPDVLLDVVATADEAPEPLVVARETIELAFLAVIQLLPPKQRAVLILRDLLDFSAAETASLLDATVPAVNSALQRARGTLQKRQGPRDDAPSSPTATEEERALVQRYMEAHEQADPAAVIALLRDDARLTISPMGPAGMGETTSNPTFSKAWRRWASFAACPSMPTASRRSPTTCGSGGIPSTGPGRSWSSALKVAPWWT